MKAYIQSAVAISPQQTFDIQGLPQEIFSPETAYFSCREPDYKSFINPAMIRRMSRVVKMGVAAALKTLSEAGIKTPDAIITGTGLGCVEDTENFLRSIIENNEQFLTPTPFIQSTHNTIGAQIALMIKCHSYNFAYVHRGFSFESALADALMQIAENQNAKVLVGGVDEITSASYTLMKRLGLFRHQKSVPAGEGAAFFLLSGEKGNAISSVSFPQMFGPPPGNDLHKPLHQFFDTMNLRPDDIDLLITGTALDPRSDSYASQITDNEFLNTPLAVYKPLCGEYMTASSFGLWFGSRFFHAGSRPDQFMIRGKLSPEVNKILVYSHYLGRNHTFMLLERC